MPSDPLSQVLDLINVRCLICGGLVASGARALGFPRPDAIKIMAVAEGACCLIIDGLGAPIRLAAGDVVHVDGKRPLILTSDPALEPMEVTTAYADLACGVARLDNAQEFAAVGGVIAIDPAGQAFQRDVLPPLIHVRSTSPEAVALTWLLDHRSRQNQIL